MPPTDPRDGPGPPSPVAIVIPLRTLVTITAFAAVVLLGVLSAGTLLSIFVAAVLGLGLDPPVGALFAAVVIIAVAAAAPLWDQIAE